MDVAHGPFVWSLMGPTGPFKSWGEVAECHFRLALKFNGFKRHNSFRISIQRCGEEQLDECLIWSFANLWGAVSMRGSE